MKENKMLTIVDTLDNGTNHFTYMGRAVDLYDALWEEITEYVANNPLEGVRNMQYHYDVLMTLEDIAYNDSAYGYKGKLYRLDIEGCYPSLSVLKAYDIDSTEAKDELYVYVRETQGINLYVVECMADGCECRETVDAVNLYYFLRDFETKHSNRNVIIKMI